MKKIRLQDIAKDLGLSVIAVSKALRGHLDIGEQTRKRVIERARELNYRPNQLAKQLLSGRTRTIGMVVPSLEINYFARLAHGATLRLRRDGYHLMMCNSEGSVELEAELIESLLAHRVDGIALCPTGLVAEQSEFQFLIDSRVPFVLSGRGVPPFPTHFVGSDGMAIGERAVEHLAERGCRRIAHIQGPSIAGSVQRRQGYERAMRKLGKRPHAIVGDRDGVDAGFQYMSLLLDSRTPPDGVFCYTDLVAAGAMKAVLDRGLGVPQDVALVGVGNLLLSDLLQVGLSTFDQNPVAIGEQTAEMLLDLVEGKAKGPATRCFVPFHLVERESTLRQSGGGAMQSKKKAAVVRMPSAARS
ncbi:MAG: LacI family DNA-binding transcriptional regulator [Acidobacteriota bacterium]